MEFEILLKQNKSALERFVHFKVSDFKDAQDIIQEMSECPISSFAVFKGIFTRMQNLYF